MTELLISLFIQNKNDVGNVDVRKKYGFLASAVGIACNVVLFILKFILGILSGSIAITADAFNNLSDAGSAVVVFFGFKLASRPADKEHPQGHGRYEYLSGFIIAVLIFLIGFEFLRGAVEKIISPSPVAFNYFVVAGLVFSVLVKLWLSFFYRKLGKKLSSETMYASSTDSISDVLTTTVTLVGILTAHFWSLPLDGYLGAFVAIMVLYAGYKVARDTLSPLLGRAPDPILVAKIREMALKHEGILDVHDIIVHDYGPGRILASLHADVPAKGSLVEIHELVDRIESEIRRELNIEAVIHIDPRDTECKHTAELFEKVKNIVGEYDKNFGIHDFRVVQDTAVFDLTVPHEDKRKNEEIINGLSLRIKENIKITIDRT